MVKLHCRFYMSFVVGTAQLYTMSASLQGCLRFENTACGRNLEYIFIMVYMIASSTIKSWLWAVKVRSGSCIIFYKLKRDIDAGFGYSFAPLDTSFNLTLGIYILPRRFVYIGNYILLFYIYFFGGWKRIVFFRYYAVRFKTY